MSLDWERLRAILATHPVRDWPALPGRSNHLPGAVLVPLREDAPTPICVLTVRAGSLRAHGHEVSFPGGRPEHSDVDLEATALREAREELGIGRANVLGRLSSVPVYTSDFRLNPFVATFAGALVPAPDEVERALEVELLPLLARASFDGIAWTIGDLTGTSPVFEIDGELVFGATAHTFYELLGVVSQWLDRPLPPLRAGRFTFEDVLRRQTQRSEEHLPHGDRSE